MPYNNKRKGLKAENSKIMERETVNTIQEGSIGKQAEIKKLKIPSSPQVKSVTILGKLLDEMTEYSVKSMPREAIGLLGGKEIRSKELEILKIIFVSEGDEVSVSFSEEDFRVFEDILKDDCYCLGWWHSHPGYGLFLSQTDINTHIYSFQLHNDLSIALVIEPTKIDMTGRAAFQFYQVIGENGESSFRYKEIASYIQH
ncbi:MAG: Mov34/MPN/PAD-1 family protein [Candidatus Heimdallarchaeota archaeon]|nr:MAG: Mov34/MPN/PAD-1 family protein [Candidatus Heimdallarchaeota archaeon]